MSVAPLRPLRAHRTGRLAGILTLSRDLRHSDRLTLQLPGEPTTVSFSGHAEAQRHAGYYRRGDAVVFSLPASALRETAGAPLVVGDFNAWQPGHTWELKLRTDGRTYELEMPLGAVCPDGETPSAFKFLTTAGQWVQPDEHAPNQLTDAYGHTNLEFHPHRSGLHVLHFTLPAAPAPDRPLWLHVGTDEGDFPIAVSVGDVFHRLQPAGPLGASVEAAGTRFRVFAPRASALRVELKHPDTGAFLRLALNPAQDGVWEAFHAANLDHWHYVLFAAGENHDRSTEFDPAEPILDPYARAAVSPAGPGIILADSHFHKHSHPFRPPAVTDLVLAEIHLADTLGLAPAALQKPTYENLTAFINRPDCPLRTLGLNAVELLPLQEFDAPHPDARPPGYHWGYMPVNWFAPTSLYAGDPAHGSQIGELRRLVTAFHDAGLAVILDVVYNHTGAPNALLRLDKNHYFITAPDGSLHNCSGCGNDYRADTPAGLRLITDSLRHWIEAYDIDGFRFDLAELIGQPALEAIRKELAPLKPGLIFIAEPWSFRGHIAKALRGSGYACWNDTFRDTLAHYVWGARPATDVLRLLTCADTAPADTLNYTESHDDFCWLDRITENPGNDATVPTANDIRRTHLMFAILMATPGATMLCAGQESLRSKAGHHNTYIRGDLSRLDPVRTDHFAATRTYVRDWIALRRSDAGRLLRPATTPPPGYYRTHQDAADRALLLEINAARHPAYPGHGLLALNPHPTPLTLTLPAHLSTTALRLVADGERVDAAGLADQDGNAAVTSGPHLAQGKIHLPPLTAALWLA